jgi:predicted nucleotidyltransferase
MDKHGMNIDAVKRDLIKSAAKKFISDAEVYLFGSRARGESSSVSDYDILVVSKTSYTPREKMTLRSSIRKELILHNLLTDVLLQSSNEIREKRKLPGHIIKSAMSEAVAL